jgi:acyl-CoA synthetase (AMP-forming)/AMP-acid ligase II
MLKTRGYRVELGELETCLQAHPLVEQAVVVAHDDELIGARLTAFVVPRKGGAEPTAKELRSYCGDALPRYMIPERFEVIGDLPLTSTGKVDRMKLRNHC